MSKVKLTLTKTDIGYMIDINDNLIAGLYSPFNRIIEVYTADTQEIINSISELSFQKPVIIEEKDLIINGEYLGKYDEAVCPHCKKVIYDNQEFVHLKNNAKHCPFCGEAIRWNNEVIRNE